MLTQGNFIDFGDDVINMDFITHIEKVKITDYEGKIITLWRVQTSEYSDYIDLTQEQYDFLKRQLIRMANSYINH